MKKSRIAKLALMGASITALAATLTTSTYAWYVSNKTANVNPVAGSTASSGAGSSISLSLTGNVNDYHKTIDLADKANGLNPVVRTGATIDNNGTSTAVYKELDEAHDADGSTAGYQVGPDSETTATEGTHYYEYKFYIKADTGCTVRPTITVKNTTAKLPTQINYSGGYQKVAAQNEAPAFATNTYYSYSAGNYTAVNSEPNDWENTYTSYYVARQNKVTGPLAGADFYVDATSALYMSLGKLAGEAYDAAGTVTTFKKTGVASEYKNEVKDVTNFMEVVEASGTQIPTGATLATAGAKNYYEEITGYDLNTAAETLYVNADSFAEFTMAANTPYLLVYHLWLDGADDQCFNACAGQTFTVAFDYTVVSQQG